MPVRPPIFTKSRLTAKALRTVADRRYGDAKALQDTGRNERANGAMYLAGFVIELLLKARLLVEYPWLSNASQAALDDEEKRELWSLCYRSHDLGEIVAHLPKLRRMLDARSHPSGRKPTEMLREVCDTWTIHARYSPMQADVTDARQFLQVVNDLRTEL